VKILQNRHVLAVHSVAASSDWYQRVLGFAEVFAIENDWRFLRREDCEIMLGECRDASPAGDLGDHSYFAYWLVDDAAGLCEQWTANGVDVCYPLCDEDWGVRNFGIRTIDGHRIMIAQKLP